MRVDVHFAILRVLVVVKARRVDHIRVFKVKFDHVALFLQSTKRKVYPVLCKFYIVFNIVHAHIFDQLALEV